MTPTIFVDSNIKSTFYDFPKVKSTNSSSSNSSEILLLSGISNFMFKIGTLTFYTRYSSIVYEGDEVSIFGVAKFNMSQSIWEITKPIAIMKEGCGKFISHLNREQLYCYLGIFCRSVVAYYMLKGIFWAGKKLIGRVFQWLNIDYRNAFNQ